MLKLQGDHRGDDRGYTVFRIMCRNQFLADRLVNGIVQLEGSMDQEANGVYHDGLVGF